MSFNYSPRIITEGLVLYLDAANTRSYPTTGTIWSDLSRNNNNGTLINGPTFNSSNGGSIVFDGVNDYVNVGNSVSLTNSFTINIWCRINSTSGGNILGFYNSVSPFNGWGLGFSQSPFLGSQLNFWDGNGWQNPNIVVVDSNWKNISVVISSVYLLSFYINGSFITSIQASTISSYNGIKAIGSRSDGLGRMLGNIAQVSIYNRVLSAQEVLQNYNATKSRFGLT